MTVGWKGRISNFIFLMKRINSSLKRCSLKEELLRHNTLLFTVMKGKKTEKNKTWSVQGYIR